ncbi:MAG: ORF6N domain-containing protein [Candidatus Cloacimonadales bacterium]
MNNELDIITSETIQNRIYTLRGVQVMLDNELAQLYDVETKYLNKAVKRNIERFPESFRFHLTQTEYDKNLRFQIGTSTLKQDVEKYNSQYPKISLNKLTKTHDRFLILDNKDLYHFGASIKDLGKKWFAFSKMEMNPTDIVSKLGKGKI